uniref:EF-hand domain-containing protein n=1 Tax=Panagrolaimus sp. ES5 TaxID=591445 RepID=A0AC34FVT8_9BILA
MRKVYFFTFSLTSFIYALLFIVQVKTLWIGEEYWTIIDHSGNLRNGRTFEDFIRFKGFDIIRDSDPYFYESNVELLVIRDGYAPKLVAHAEKKRCRHRNGPIVTPDDLNPFNINNNADPRPAHPANPSECQSVFYDLNGDGHINIEELYACRYGRIIRDSDPYFYESNVELLVIRDGYAPKLVAHAEKKRCRHRNGPIVTPDDLNPFNVNNNAIPRPVHPANPSECQSVFYDLNGDGHIDNEELYACRYGRVGCSIQIYDANKDGYLDFEELEDCKRVLESDKYVRYCQDAYFDIDRNGHVDSYELERCLQRHDPSRRREFLSSFRAKRKEEFENNNEANELKEKEKIVVF